MKITRETISKTKVKLIIELDTKELNSAEEVALTKLAKTLKVPGFRKGHVPITVAKKHVDPNHLAEETANNALSKAVADAFTQEDLRALERPEVEVVKFVPNKELTFSAEAEVIPKIKLGSYKKLKTPKQPDTTASKTEVGEILERIRTQMADKKEVKRAAKDGDEVVIDFIGKKDGTAFEGGAGNEYPLLLGSNSFIPGFEEAIVGHKIDETFDVDLKFPKDYHVKDLAGQPVTFTVTIKKIQEMVKPDLNDELAAKVGPYTSVDELKSDIEREITARNVKEATQKLQDDLIGQLVEKSDVPVPDVLKQDQIDSIERDATQNLLYQNIPMEDWLQSKGYDNKDAWIEKEVAPLAEKRAKASLVLAELARVAEITATDEELQARLAQFKQEHANQPAMAQRFDEPEVIQSVANQILTEKTIDLIVKENVK